MDWWWLSWLQCGLERDFLMVATVFGGEGAAYMCTQDETLPTSLERFPTFYFCLPTLLHSAVSNGRTSKAWGISSCLWKRVHATYSFVPLRWGFVCTRINIVFKRAQTWEGQVRPFVIMSYMYLVMSFTAMLNWDLVLMSIYQAGIAGMGTGNMSYFLWYHFLGIFVWGRSANCLNVRQPLLRGHIYHSLNFPLIPLKCVAILLSLLPIGCL